jgi:hypothetical protein
VLAVDPGEINLIWQAGSLPKGVFRIANKGGLSLKWTIIRHPSWIGIYPSSGAIDVGKEVSVEARAAGSVPKAGIYSGPIMISSAGAINSPATVKVMLVVAAKPKPGWLWPVVGVVVVVVAGTVVLLRPKKAKRKDTPPKADVAVHPTKDAGVQKIKTKPPIVKFCLGINIVVGEGVFRVRKNQKIIASVKRKEG